MNNKKIKPQMDFKVLSRVMKYITKNYKFKLVIVLISIVLSTISSVAGNLYLQVLIDDYIVPLVGVQNPVYTELLHAIGTMCVIYLVGVITSYVYSRVMVYISEGTLKIIRDEMCIKIPNW